MLAGRVPAGWATAIEAWAGGAEVIVVERLLDGHEAGAAIDLFRRGDPLGMAIPLGYIGRKESEAKNLRMIGRALFHDLPRQDVLDRLLEVA